MRPGKLILISGLIVCIGLTFWQKNNLKTIFGEYRATKKFYYHTREGWRNKTPIINEKIAKIDPQAAAIINYQLNDNLYHLGDEQRTEALSNNILKFPDNQYFIYTLSEWIFHDSGNCFDPVILLKLSNRLIELDDKNSNYYYLKAYALLHLRQDNNFDEVIKAVKSAASCEYHKDPYLMYIDRIVAISQKQGLPKEIIEELEYVFEYNFFIGKIYDALMQYENLLITERDFAKADEISNTLKSMISDKMREPLINNNQSLYPFPLYGLGVGFGRWNLPQEMELQLKDLPQPEADKKRMEICAIVNPEKKVEYVNKFYEPGPETQIYATAVSPFLYFVRMAGVLIFIIAILTIVSFSRKNELNNGISKAALIRFLIYGFVCLIASQLLAVISFLEHSCCYSYKEIFLFKHIALEDLKDLMDAPKRFLIIPFIPFAIVFCFGVISFLKRGFDNIVTRFISAILLAIPLGLAAMILQGHTYIKYVPIIIFLLFAFKYSFRKITIRTILKAFTGCRDEEIPAIRNDLLKFSCISFFLCWFGLTLLAYPARKSMNEKPSKRNVYSYSFTNDYEKAYQNILKKIDDTNLPRANIVRCIPLVKSEDLPGVMQKLKNRKFPSYWTLHPEAFCPSGNKDYDTLTERSISFLLMTAGRDQMPIILRYMDNPDNGIALIFRAQLGDKSVKEKLVNILGKMIKDSNQAEAEQRGDYDILKPRESQVVFALAAISEPDEAFELIKDFYKRCSTNDDYVRFEFNDFCTLPREVILKIYNFHLDDLVNKIKDSNNDERYFPLSPFFYEESESLYLDNQVAEKMLKMFLMNDKIDEQISRLGIEHYLTLDDADLLLKGLQSDNENLRAWCLWQLKKNNYKFSEDELEKLAGDKSWKVRANLAIFDKSLINDNETSAFVNLLKAL